MAANPIEPQKGEDISPFNQPSNDDHSGLGVEEVDAGRAVQKDSQDDPHVAEAASSSSHQDRVTHEDTSSAPVISVRGPGSATQAEIDERDKTHLPYTSWRPVCVMAKGKEDGHFPGRSFEVGKPIISFDYKRFGRDLKEDDKVTSIVSRDGVTKCTNAHIVTAKGALDTWAIDQILGDVDALGHAEVILKGDGEPALQQVLKEVKKRIHPTIIQAPPAYDPQSNVVAEHAVQDYIGHLRAVKLGLERRWKEELPTKLEIIEWASEHSAFLFTIYQVGKDGQTSWGDQWESQRKTRSWSLASRC